jgi:cytochrome c553
MISDLEAFRSGEMSGSIMGRLVGGLTEAEIDAIARYFASIAEGE